MIVRRRSSSYTVVGLINYSLRRTVGPWGQLGAPRFFLRPCHGTQRRALHTTVSELDTAHAPATAVPAAIEVYITLVSLLNRREAAPSPKPHCIPAPIGGDDVAAGRHPCSPRVRPRNAPGGPGLQSMGAVRLRGHTLPDTSSPLGRHRPSSMGVARTRLHHCDVAASNVPTPIVYVYRPRISITPTGYVYRLRYPG